MYLILQWIRTGWLGYVLALLVSTNLWTSYGISQPRTDAAACMYRLQAEYKTTVPSYDVLMKHVVDTSADFVSHVVALMAVESGFNSKARSPVGAVGIMQVMPIARTEVQHVVARYQRLLLTAEYLTVAELDYYANYISRCTYNKLDKLSDIRHNIQIGSCYFAWALRFTGSYMGALVIYNGGLVQYNRFVRGQSIASETANHVLKTLYLINKFCTEGL
jgi:hypothetical protein